jgi:hypothetical protein
MVQGCFHGSNCLQVHVGAKDVSYTRIRGEETGSWNMGMTNQNFEWEKPR